MEQTDAACASTTVLNTDIFMARCDDRLRSFDGKWPKHFFIKPSDLARNGFYSEGRSDWTKCFSCKLILKDWKPIDQVELEHYRWSPNCAYLQMTSCSPKSNKNSKGVGRDVFNSCACDA